MPRSHHEECWPGMTKGDSDCRDTRHTGHTSTRSWTSLLAMSMQTEIQLVWFVLASVHQTDQHPTRCPLTITHPIHGRYALYACKTISRKSLPIVKSPHALRIIIVDLQKCLVFLILRELFSLTISDDSGDIQNPNGWVSIVPITFDHNSKVVKEFNTRWKQKQINVHILHISAWS